MTTEKVILIAQVKSLGESFQPVKVKMKQRISFPGMVFVDNGERRTVYHIGRAQHLTDLPDESGLSGSHLSIKSKNPPLRKFGDQFARHLAQFFPDYLISFKH